MIGFSFLFFYFPLWKLRQREMELRRTNYTTSDMICCVCCLFSVVYKVLKGLLCFFFMYSIRYSVFNNSYLNNKSAPISLCSTIFLALKGDLTLFSTRLNTQYVMQPSCFVLKCTMYKVQGTCKYITQCSVFALVLSFSRNYRI